MDKIEMLHELCKALTEEMETIAEKVRKGGMSAGDLETIDKLAHALKSIKTVIAMMEADDEDYSYNDGRSYEGRSYRGGRSNQGRSNRGGRSYEGRSYNDGRSYNSYARGRNARRDSRGRYSGDGYSYAEEMDEVLDDMRELLPDLPDEKRHKAEKLMEELAQ